jgi:hypothetical protein
MDYSSVKFSFNSQAPDFLPARLRLPEGKTRYSNNIELEEIFACGYKGPFETPFVEEDSIITWDCENCTYIIRKKTSEENKNYVENLNTRIYIKKLLESEADFTENSSLYTEKYFRAMFDYYQSLRNLLSSSNNLTNEDIPQVPSPPMFFVYKTDEDAAYEEWYSYNRESLKNDFETYGVVFNVLDQFRHRFKVESSWVLGNNPIPSDSIPPLFDYRVAD